MFESLPLYSSAQSQKMNISFPKEQLIAPPMVLQEQLDCYEWSLQMELKISEVASSRLIQLPNLENKSNNKSDDTQTQENTNTECPSCKLWKEWGIACEQKILTIQSELNRKQYKMIMIAQNLKDKFEDEKILRIKKQITLKKKILNLTEEIQKSKSLIDELKSKISSQKKSEIKIQPNIHTQTLNYLKQKISEQTLLKTDYNKMTVSEDGFTKVQNTIQGDQNQQIDSFDNFDQSPNKSELQQSCEEQIARDDKLITKINNISQQNKGQNENKQILIGELKMFEMILKE